MAAYDAAGLRQRGVDWLLHGRTAALPRSGDAQTSERNAIHPAAPGDEPVADRVVDARRTAFGWAGLRNGKGAVQLWVDGDLGLELTMILLGLNILATLATLRTGAAGGRLTPSLSIGALLAIVLGAGWHQFWPVVPLAAFAMVGAAAFLAVSIWMPLAAIALAFELTRADQDFLVPVLFAVCGALAMSWFCEDNSRPEQRCPIFRPVTSP